jgi:DNA repair protein RadA/Sms
MTNCHRCDSPLKSEGSRCQKCGAWNTIAVKVTEGPAFDGAEHDGTILLSKVTSAEQSRIHLGYWDPIWGGGIVPTSTSIFAGEPGSGKSTGLLQLLHDYMKLYVQNETLYVAAEECKEEVRMRADRLGVQNQDRLRIVPAMQGVSNLADIMRNRKPGLIIFDSLQGLAPDDPTMQKDLCRVAKEYSIVLQSPIIIISQVNGEGDILGVEALQHAVDTTMLMSVDEAGLRCLTVKKNRFGPAQVSMYFEMTEKGLSIARKEDLEDEDDDEDEDEDLRHF